MRSTSTFDWSGPERAQYYRALAEMLSLSDHSVARQVQVLLKMDCGDMLMPSATSTIDAQVTEWATEGEQPHMSTLLRELFGVGFCSKQLPSIPACMAFYVRDAATVRTKLRSAYERWDYEEGEVFAPDCEGTGYVSRQLAFAAHCIERGCDDPSSLVDVAEVLRESLFDWAPLFARALVVSRAHPAVVFVGVKLECLLDNEHVLASRQMV